VIDQPAVEAGQIRVVHRTTRRFRLKLPVAGRSGARLAALHARLTSTEGVLATEVNGQTGSILVHHDVSVTLEDLLEQAGLSEDVLVEALPPRLREQVRGEASHVAQRLADRFFEADAQLSRVTGGWLDLKMAIPLGLLGAGVWRLLAEGFNVLEAPPYLFLWWSFDSFVKLHQPQIERSVVPAARVGRAARLRSQPIAEP
jgi:sulfur carrier protein ThiS